MEENVKENAVVENVSTENVIEENYSTENETLEAVEETKTDDSVKEFDGKAFAESASFTDKPQENEKKEIETNEFSWSQNKEPEVEKEKLQENPTTTENSFDWTSTGIDGVKSKEDFDKKLQEFKSYETKVKEYEVSSVKNNKINRLENFLKLDDKALLTKDLELQGFSKEKLEEAIDTYEYNNTISIEAQKIRNTVDRAISHEKQNELKSHKNEEAKLIQERESSKAELKNHLENTETMFGFKMAKDEAGLTSVRNDHYEYITSGTFLNSVMDSNTNLSEAAWLWKNKETIFKALKNNGFQKGRQEILNDIQKPEVVGTQRILDPSGKTDEFNPNAFIFGT